MNPYSRLIPRLNGEEIDERFDYYEGLVNKGVAGFIVFGGELETVRDGIGRLQAESDSPLMFASDLEQGLGQQIRGGTTFPPAMAIAAAIRNQKSNVKGQELLRDTFKAMAIEAKYAGINTILAPVLDINTNPANPIIATRAFGEDPETVSRFGCEMISVLSRHGVITCGKHFPGHGDTGVDSHIGLPVIGKELSQLEDMELAPFRDAVRKGVDMIMLGHLSVPSIDPSGVPVSLSPRAVSYVREALKFSGALITDAMNMGGLGGYHEGEATLMALNAGVDLILHPTDPDATAASIRLGKPVEPIGPIGPIRPVGPIRAEGPARPIDFHGHQQLSDELATMAVTIEGSSQGPIRNPFLLLVRDEETCSDRFFLDAMRDEFPGIRHFSLFPESPKARTFQFPAVPEGHDLVVGVFSSVRAWKGGGEWLKEVIDRLDSGAVSGRKIFISFGNPYILRSIRGSEKIYAYWDCEASQKEAVKRLTNRAGCRE